MLKAKVLYEFVSSNTDQLNVIPGEIISIIKRDDGDGWSHCCNEESFKGNVPTSYLQILCMDNVEQKGMILDGKSCESIIKMPKKFMKNGGKEFMLGEGEISPVTEAEVEICIEKFGENYRWKYLGEEECSINISSLDSPMSEIKENLNFEITSTCGEKSVNRTYKDFCWLYAKLKEKFPCVVIPPLPKKQKDESICMSKLEIWLNYVTKHPVLSYSLNINHFITVEDACTWNIGREVIEKDKSKNGGFFFTVKAPSDNIQWRYFSNRINKISNFIDHFGPDINVLYDHFQTLHRHQNAIFKQFQNLGCALVNLSESMLLNPDNRKDTMDLINVIRKTGYIYRNQGLKIRDKKDIHFNLVEKAKRDAEIVEDNLYEISSVTEKIPKIINLAKSTVSTVVTCLDKTQELQIDMEMSDKIDQRAQIVANAINAELNWLQEQRSLLLRKALVDEVKNRIQFYSEITANLMEMLSSLYITKL